MLVCIVDDDAGLSIALNLQSSEKSPNYSLNASSRVLLNEGINTDSIASADKISNVALIGRWTKTQRIAA